MLVYIFLHSDVRMHHRAEGKDRNTIQEIIKIIIHSQCVVHISGYYRSPPGNLNGLPIKLSQYPITNQQMKQ